MISKQLPGHMVATARTGFLRAIREVDPMWQKVATTHTLTANTSNLVDLGAAPMPKNSKSGLTLQDMIERKLDVAPQDWDITVYVSANAISDDQTGTLESKVRAAGANFNKHINKITFEAINSGAATTDYGPAYDGLSFFDANHVDAGAQYQTVQSNTNALALTPDNFETVYVAASNRLDDQGEYTALIPDLLIVPPAYQRVATQIADNADMYNTANNEKNPWSGKVGYITAPWLDSTSWYLASTSETAMPLIVVMREQPALQSAWFDPEKPDGGWYLFKYFARYDIAYGDWRLMTEGNT